MVRCNPCNGLVEAESVRIQVNMYGVGAELPRRRQGRRRGVIQNLSTARNIYLETENNRIDWSYDYFASPLSFQQ